MSSSAQAELLHRVDRFYESHSRKCVSIAALLVGVSSFGGSLLLYMLFGDFLVAIMAFLLIGVAVVFAALYSIVPPTKKIQVSKNLIVGALNEPSRIKAVERKHVVLENDAGKAVQLNQLEQQLWSSIIVPYFMQNTASMRQRKGAGPGRRLTESEERQMEKRQAQLFDLEKSIKQEREQLEQERSDLSQRSASLKEAEDLVVERLNSVERSQAELEQLREELAGQASPSNLPISDEEAKLLRNKERTLKAKELELDRLRAQLSRDQESLASQKVELADLQELVSTHSEDEKVKRLAIKAKELEEAAQDLERRSRYVSEVEDSLVTRLNELSEREASIEQGEVDSGLRSD
ncbi:MAG: hypothetical protein ACPGES_09395 [Coraliomargarita sp.]